MYKLRELSNQDIPTINQWRNNNELINYLGASFRYINIDVECRWYENYLNNRSSNIRCAIVEDGKEDLILGLASLTNIEYINQSAIFHIMIGEAKYRGKGIGYFAITEILKHAFEDLNLNRVELTVLASNTRAVNLYEKVGFQKEGVKRQSNYKNGHFVDMIMMSILKEEFTK